jgi:hypothetical protein
MFTRILGLPRFITRVTLLLWRLDIWQEAKLFVAMMLVQVAYKSDTIWLKGSCRCLTPQRLCVHGATSLLPPDP